MNYFKLSKIKFDELSTEVTDFIQSVYKNTRNMFTAASPWGQIMVTLINLSQKIFYYIEDSITEMFMTTASRPNSIRGLAVLAGHNPTRAISASGSLMISHNGIIPDMSGPTITIKNLSRLKNNDTGLMYTAVFSEEELKLNLFQPGEKRMFKIYQGYAESQTFTSNGNLYQSFNIFTKLGLYVDQFMISVYVNGEKWGIKDSFLDLTYNEKACIVRTGINGGLDLYFGNNNFGLAPSPGAEIKVEYLLNNGEDGNIVNNDSASFEFLDSGYDSQGTEIDLNEIFNIYLATPVNFASNPEPLFLTKLIAPNTSRSFVLANTSHYFSFFEKFQLFSYIDIFTKFDYVRPWLDNIVYCLLIPDISKRYRKGENYFTIPEEYFKLTDLEKIKIYNLVEQSGKKIINSILKFVDPIFKKYVLYLYVKTWEGYNKDNVYNSIIERLSSYFSSFKRNDILPKSDIIASLEGIDGLDSVSLFFISEDIEKVMSALLTLNTTNENLDDIPELFKNGNPSVINNITTEFKKYNDLNTDTKLRIIFSQLEIRQFAADYIDINGDIVIQNGTIPLFRGGWKDRVGTTYLSGLSKNQSCAVNVIFTKESSRQNSDSEIRYSYNKSL
jgi:hypothetical protein